MNRLLRAALPVALATLSFAAPALAADYDPPVVVDEVDDYVPVEVGNGWYLRGDIGYAMKVSASGNFSYRTFDPLTSTYSNNTFATGRLNGNISYNVGFGYQYNSFLRGDLTLSSFQGRFNGTTASANPCLPVGFAGTGCRSEDQADFTALTLLANGYVDLGTYAGFTPYVGGGLGATYMDWRNLTNRSYCVDGGALCPAPGGVITTTTHPGESSWRLTYALMGGVAYDISKNLKLDLGYKFQHISGGAMFGWDLGSAGAGATGVQGRDSGFSTHEVRLGLRYALW